MANPQEILRNYHNLSDVEMTQFSHTVRSAFTVDKALFTTFDPDFNDPFSANWLTKIEAAEALPSDEAVQDELTQLSNAVEEKMELCRHKFQSSKFFIEKTFPANFAVQNEFGYDDYEDARRSQVKMIGFMSNFFRVANKYKVKLIAKNYTQPMINEIGALHDQLHDANNAQEAFKSVRPVITQDRIIILNACWDETLKVCSAGKIIFYNNMAKHDQFLLPDSAGGGGTPAVASIGIVSDQSTISGMPLEIIISGNLSASGGGILATWESGVSNSANLSAGGTIVFQHVYAAAGIKNIDVTEVTAGVFGFIASLQMPNVNATVITLSGDFSSATTFNFYGNKIPLSNLHELLTQINLYGTSGGLLNLSGGTMPVPDPAFAPLIALRSRGWMVTTN
ncbi:MAG: hypothetical protein HY840_15910 [Bacteroidetes bacterium]|nr:hypothetical protein [Bacteroidota bacterium]